VHGCYWHGHGCSVGGTGAKSNQAYWGPKIAGNKVRDNAHLKKLRSAGWNTLVIWECETRDPKRLATVLYRFLGRKRGARHGR